MTGGSGIPVLPAMLMTLFLFSLPAIYLLATDRRTESPKSHEAHVTRHRKESAEADDEDA